jgi:hypothetical protein
MTKSIEVVISPNGQTRIETRGYSGESCRDASRFLEEALGLRIAETSTAEAHQIAQQAAQQKSR